jgi:putative Mg2+ transporter-C (MgtC) family protein
METVWHELAAEVGDIESLLRVTLRLFLAGVLGSIIGLQREHIGQSAGWRTHILVSMAATLFVLAMAESGGTHDDISRVIQGVATGIGFLGAGAILKLSTDIRVKGLTTSASIWLTAGVGVAVGAGRIWLPTIAALLGWSTLALLARLEHHIQGTVYERDD